MLEDESFDGQEAIMASVDKESGQHVTAAVAHQTLGLHQRPAVVLVNEVNGQHDTAAGIQHRMEPRTAPESPSGSDLSVARSVGYESTFEEYDSSPASSVKSEAIAAADMHQLSESVHLAGVESHLSILPTLCLPMNSPAQVVKTKCAAVIAVRMKDNGSDITL